MTKLAIQLSPDDMLSFLQRYCGQQVKTGTHILTEDYGANRAYADIKGLIETWREENGK